jgi:hypothetical protein
MSDETTPRVPSEASAESFAEDIPALPDPTESTPLAGEDYHAPMSRGDVAVLAIRLLGVFLMIQGSAFLGMLGMVFSGLRSGVEGLGSALALTAPYGIYFSLGIVLVATAGWVGPKLLPNVRRSDDAAGRASARDIQAVGFSVVGVTIAVWSIAELASAIWYLVFRTARRSDDRTAWDMASPLLVQFAVKAGVGVVLFLGAKGLATLWHRVREPNPLNEAADDVPEAAEPALPPGDSADQMDQA